MHRFTHPRCCEVLTLGRGDPGRHVLAVGRMAPQVLCELTPEAPAELARALARVLGGLPDLPASDLVVAQQVSHLAAARLELTLDEPDVVLRAWSSDEPQPMVLITLDRQGARVLGGSCARALAGRVPTCPFCGLPLEAGGHVCPRANGYRR